jgi:ABC-2 type transport system permease protein
VRSLQLLARVNAVSLWRRFASLREQSWLLVASVSLFLAGYAVLAFTVFRFGLGFLSRFPGLGGLLVERLLYVLFAFLFGLLLISNLVVSYTNFFRNRETTFLLTLPMRAEEVLTWKMLESTVLASWAFLFLVAPLLAAYGLSNGVAWHFYPAVAVLVVLFIILPGVFGSVAAIQFASRMDRKAFQLILLAGLAGLVVFVWMQIRPFAEGADEQVRVLAVIDKLLDNSRFADFPLLPSYWLSASVENWAEGGLRAAGFFALVTLSNALFFGAGVSMFFGRAFRDATSDVQSRGDVWERWAWFRRLQERRKRLARVSVLLRPNAWLDGALAWRGLLPVDVRALVAKDLRVFWRDTTQWGQTAMLFGLLTVYIVNLRHFTRQLESPFWVALVSFLNLGACALNVATITTRFVFPQFSLEGKRVWLVGLSPLGLSRVLWLKFWLGSALTLALTEGLILLSGSLLGLDFAKIVFFGAAIAVMCFGLNALAVGLGALYPNFRETNPTKIVSGFGGTFCLVASFLYIVSSVLVLALGSPWGWRQDSESAFWALKAGVAWTVFMLGSFLVGWLPMRLGLERVANAEL